MPELKIRRVDKEWQGWMVSVKEDGGDSGEEKPCSFDEVLAEVVEFMARSDPEKGLPESLK